MIKTLGPWARLIPEEEQNTIVAMISHTRQCPIHRGMLPFIPVKEMLTAIRHHLSDMIFYEPKSHRSPMPSDGYYRDKFLYELAYNAIMIAASFAAIEDEPEKETKEESTNESNSQPGYTSDRDLPLPS